MDISVIIVNYNTSDHLRKCLDSIRKYTGNVQFEVIVIDNDSPQRDIEEFPTQYPWVRFFFRDRNDGFGAGCNYGSRVAKGKYYLFLNPDVYLISDVIFDIFKLVENDPGIGAASAIYVEENGELGYTFNKFPGLKWEMFESFGFGATRKIGKMLSSFEIKNNLPLEVDWVMGSFIFVRSDVFDKVQGFDEDIFMYYEDVDLQYKIRRKLGYKIVCYPFLKVKHYKRSSVRSEFGENLYYYHMSRSIMLYMYKNFGFLKRNFIRTTRITGVLFRLIVLPIRKKFKGKKRQKLFQYKLMLGLFLSSKRNVICKRAFENQSFYSSANDNYHDKFWRS